MITRRQFSASTSYLVASPLALSGCSEEPATGSYVAVAARTWQLGAVTGLRGAALGRELVRSATLTPSSHNTQWRRFALDGQPFPYPSTFVMLKAPKVFAYPTISLLAKISKSQGAIPGCFE